MRDIRQLVVVTVFLGLATFSPALADNCSDQNSEARKATPDDPYYEYVQSSWGDACTLVDFDRGQADYYTKSESRCKGLSGYQEWHKDGGSGYNLCVFTPPSESPDESESNDTPSYDQSETDKSNDDARDATDDQPSSTESECDAGQKKCPDGLCYPNENDCCAHHGSCNPGYSCWGFGPTDICCKWPELVGQFDGFCAPLAAQYCGNGKYCTSGTCCASGCCNGSTSYTPSNRDQQWWFELKICNHTKRPIDIALAGLLQPDDRDFTVQGWWTIASNQCVGPFNFVKGKFFYYGQSAKNVWEGHTRLCVRSHRFRYVAQGGPCTEKWVNFREQLVDDDSYTLTLTK